MSTELKKSIKRNTLHWEELYLIVLENGLEPGWDPEEFYDQAFEEAHWICEPKHFHKGCDGVHFCLQYTKKAFLRTCKALKKEIFPPVISDEVIDLTED